MSRLHLFPTEAALEAAFDRLFRERPDCEAIHCGDLARCQRDGAAR